MPAELNSMLGDAGDFHPRASFLTLTGQQQIVLMWFSEHTLNSTDLYINMILGEVLTSPKCTYMQVKALSLHWNNK